jgi:S-adenosylmethionine hydrolase
METERRSGIISLITDFGLADTYVGQIKAVILGIDPALRIVDLAHTIPPQDVAEAAFQLATAWRAFPEGSVHLAVIDPGVGTPRRPIVFRHHGHYFVMPDNGLATLVLGNNQPDRLVVLDRPAIHRPVVSPTFHGRDIFAPVAASLAAGRPLDEVGSVADFGSLIRLAIPAVEREGARVWGPVVSIDHFGNCRTLIQPGDLPAPPNRVQVRCGPVVIRGIVPTYGSVPSGHTLALFGSHGGLEIAVRDGNAARAWDITRGSIVELSEDAHPTRPADVGILELSSGEP